MPSSTSPPRATWTAASKTPRRFVRTNVDGTHNLIQACREARRAAISCTSAPTRCTAAWATKGEFTEESPLQPNSPYAATKAASDLLVLAYVRTHKFPAVVTRCSNNYGPYQFPGKVHSADDRAGDGGRATAGLRHRAAMCATGFTSAITAARLDAVLQRGREGEVYNIGGGCEMRNLEVAKLILRALGPLRIADSVRHRPSGTRPALRHQLREAGTRAGLAAAGYASMRGWRRPSRGIAKISRGWTTCARGQYRDYFQKHYVQREKTFAP